MSYECGIGGGMRRIGFEPREPAIRCDGCGITVAIANRTSFAPKWFLDGKAPKGWKRIDDCGKRRDYCPRCRPKEAA